MRGTEVDAIHASYAQGVRDGRRDERETWRREVGKLRDRCRDVEHSLVHGETYKTYHKYFADRLTSLLARHAPGEAPAAPDLRTMVEELRETLQEVEWRFIANRWRCPSCMGQRTDGHKTDCRLSAALKAADAPAAPKVEEAIQLPLQHHPDCSILHGFDFCNCVVKYFDRRKGGEG